MLKLMIVGGGNLGFRYAQGIMKLKNPFHLTIIDKSYSRLEFLKKTFTEDNLSLPDNIELLANLREQRFFDLVIISTNSDIRLNVFDEYYNNHIVNFWILEKVLTSNIDELSLFQKEGKIWVNTFLRSLNIFKNIKKSIPKSNVEISVSGGNWGLACNSIHYIDLISWIFNNVPIIINSENLDSEWFSSKRDGFYEVNGSLTVLYPENVILSITCNSSSDDLIIVFKSNSISYKYNLISGVFQSNGVIKSNILIPYQSDITPNLVNEIIETKQSSLTPISESIEMHSLFLTAMTKSWDRSAFTQGPIRIT